MKKLSVNELREMFLSFFESKNHLRLKSFSLVPHNDDSLLLINSGMAPLKPYFKGLETPPRKRVTTCQKCIRTGDLENVGKTARHGTFFEMLGNFSFGDYFKKEAITWSWEFLTEVVGLDKNRLYPSVYKDDNEAWDLWHDMIGIPEDKIFRFGKEDNFWEHGAGPCGPCSEIYYDRGEKYGCGKPGCTVGCDCDRYMEVWNNVFTQFDNDGKNNYTELVQKNIDTGMGLERLAVVCQDAESIFEVDTNKELMDKISLVTGHLYKEDPIDDVSLRIISDHIKSCTFMISDGILPSNEGRGYVLRRLLRRAVRHGRKLGVKRQFLKDLADTVIKQNGTHYTELVEKKDLITNILNQEEEKFNQTIDQGLSILNEYAVEMLASNKKVLDGDKAFKLYDTFGFPLDITKEILEEKNMTVDEKGFEELMTKQRDTARSARKVSTYMGADTTCFDSLPKEMVSTFEGYDKNDVEGKVLSLAKDGKLVDSIKEGDEAVIILDKTSLYPLMGGQEGDNGTLKGNNFEYQVLDTIKILNTKIGHIGKVVKGECKIGDKLIAHYDEIKREATAINHTSTHLLQAALRQVLGNHVEQAGSSVNSERLRFDFNNFNPMTKEEIKKVEDIVNAKIRESINVDKKEMGLEEAKKAGAMALFGEKYGDRVRTVKVGDFSFELCGGTHMDNTREAKVFKILSETGISQGVRRIEAITSDRVYSYLIEEEKELNELASTLKVNAQDLPKKLNQLLNENKELKQEIDKLKREASKQDSGSIKVEDINGIKVVCEVIKNKTKDEVKSLIDVLKSNNSNSAIVLLGESDGQVFAVSAISGEALKKGLHAGNLIKEVAPIFGGRGGGRDSFAECGGKDSTKLEEAKVKAYDYIKNAI